jgi:hypothetical protein
MMLVGELPWPPGPWQFIENRLPERAMASDYFLLSTNQL